MVGRSLPPERRATCHDCVMCSSDDWSAGFPELQYDPEVRCCTFVPELWNFQLGAILSDPELAGPHGHDAVRGRIRSVASQVLPLGIAPDKDSRDNREFLLSRGGFGRDETLRCPHFVVEDGACGIWRYRNATCATWFCRFERGVLGYGFWQAIRKLLQGLETTLAVAAADTLLGEQEDPASFGPWTGRREAFYVACWEVVCGLTWDDLAPRAPKGLLQRLDLVRRAFAVMDRPSVVPSHPRKHRPKALDYDDTSVLADTYLTIDPIVLPRRLWEHLGVFDGRPVAEALEALAEKGVTVDRALLERLSEWDVIR